MTFTIETTNQRGHKICLLYDKHEGYQVRVSSPFNGMYHTDSIRSYHALANAKRAYKRTLKNYL